MRSFATRLSLRFAGVFALLLFALVAFTSLIIVADATKTAQGRVAAAEADVHRLSALYAAAGRPLSSTAQDMVQSVSSHQVRIAVFDGSGRLLAGDGSLSGMPTIRFFDRLTVPGGSVALAPAGDLGQGLVGYWILMFILGGIGLLVAWIVGRHLATQSLRPVTDVTNALTKLADGDFSRRTFVMEERSEVGSLAYAFNAAADTVASAIATRDAAEARMRQFVADAGHELRTPLTVIMGYVDVLRRGAVREEALAGRILESIGGEGVRMRTLIDQLLLLARLEDGVPVDEAPVDVSATIADVVGAFQASSPGREITSSVGSGLMARCDASELRAALANLIENALKYAPSSPVTVTAARTDESIDITVADRGPGMTAHERARAFDRFYRGDNRGQVTGAGLGLAIVKRSVERAHGSIDLVTAPGAGTQVTIHLPAGA